MPERRSRGHTRTPRRLGADPARVGVGGDSAGGNLAAVVSQLSARDGGPAPALQLLIYPATDMSTRRRSRELFAEGFFLTDAEMQWFEASYLGAAAKSEVLLDPRVSPMLAEDLSGLPPAIVITAGFDPLRDEGEDYAHALAGGRDAHRPAPLRRLHPRLRVRHGSEPETARGRDRDRRHDRAAPSR